MQGTVKWFAPEKGYGFITGEDGTEVFVHHTAIRMDGYRTLLKGQKVNYETQEQRAGQAAVNVSVEE